MNLIGWKSLYVDNTFKVLCSYYSALSNKRTVWNNLAGYYIGLFGYYIKNYFLFNNFFWKNPKKNNRACMFIRERRVVHKVLCKKKFFFYHLREELHLSIIEISVFCVTELHSGEKEDLAAQNGMRWIFWLKLTPAIN